MYNNVSMDPDDLQRCLDADMDILEFSEKSLDRAKSKVSRYVLETDTFVHPSVTN